MTRTRPAYRVRPRPGLAGLLTRVALVLLPCILGVQDAQAKHPQTSEAKAAVRSTAPKTALSSRDRRPLGSGAKVAAKSAGAIQAQQIRANLQAQVAKKHPQVPSARPPHGYVYVETNEGGVEGMNAIRTFARDARGLLTELPGSPFPTFGTGVHPTTDLSLANLGPFDSDQALIFNSTRTRLFAVNSGSDTVAVLDVRSNGTLVHVKGSPFFSGGINPVSVGLAKDSILVVANKDYDLGRPGFDPQTQASYASFQVSPKGQLSLASVIPANNLPINGPGRATPTQALISPNGQLAFDANFFGFLVRSFQIQANGSLTPADAQLIPKPGGTNALGLPIPLGLQVHPTQPILYVGFVLDNSLGVYTYDSAGKLSFVQAVTNVGIQQGGPCWLLANAEGTRLYVSNNFENTIAVFDLTNPLQPVKIQTLILAQGLGNAAPFHIALDEREQFLHVVTQKATTPQDPALANGLQVVQVSPGGYLHVVDFVPLPSFDGSRPQGVAAK